MLLYALLHLAGVKAKDGPAVSLDDIKQFRQLDSKCPGHPEYGLTVGVETTTGPLGQGCGNSVGMAIASRWLAAHFNRPGFALFDYDVYAMCGDGDMMEGISSEAASLAGHLKLGNLCWIYDNNGITIEGHTDLAFGDDVGARFRAYGWHVEHVKDANDIPSLDKAFAAFCSRTDAPTLIIVDSHIGFGAPHKQDTAAAHGEPLGADEIRLAKRNHGWPEDAQFLVPTGVREHFAEGIGTRGAKHRQDWSKLMAAYRAQHPTEARQLDQMLAGEVPAGWDADLPKFAADPKGVASRDSSGKVMNAFAPHYPAFVGGSADLAPSTKTRLTFDGAGDLEPGTLGGRNMHFGIREHAMGAVVNGMVLSGVRASGSSFLIFSDYMKPTIRLALMDLPAIHVFTHDSIGLGEDGPTHQSIEQLAGLRAIPRLVTLRPGDANEVVEAWRVIVGLKHQPACLVLSRQALPTLDRGRYAPAAGVARGAYVLADAKPGKPEVILIGTGSEVSLCVEAYEALARDGVAARLVSMPRPIATVSCQPTSPRASRSRPRRPSAGIVMSDGTARRSR
jgi:transketolase